MLYGHSTASLGSPVQDLDKPFSEEIIPEKNIDFYYCYYYNYYYYFLLTFEVDFYVN